MFNSKKDIVKVKFIDIETGKVFAKSDMPPDHLPQSFEAQTTLNIQNQYWEVIEAIPMTSEEFIKSKSLILKMKKVVIGQLDPNELRFSLPTISNLLPTIEEGSSKLNKNIFEIREDDWRQIDILPISETAVINQNLAAIQNIYKEKSLPLESGLCFTELHVINSLDTPFSNKTINASELFAHLPNSTAYEGISFAGIAGTIENGFALDLNNDLILYGLMKSNILQSLSLFAHKYDEHAISQLTPIFSKFELCIVDWCRAKLF